jgi:hypothetical protein
MNKQKRVFAIMLIILIFLLIVTGLLVYTNSIAEQKGNNIGETKGQIVGVAVGSVKGITEGIEAGKEAGEADGLSAEDTKADIKGTMESVGKLEVLVAGVTLKNMNQIGETYKNLSIVNADAVFTVDLGAAEISYSSSGQDIYISIDEPELDLYVDLNSSETLLEVQKFSRTVSAEDGINDYLNSIKQTVSKVKETMTNYDTLMATAESTAKEQVHQLASTVCGNGTTVHVQFK